VAKHGVRLKCWQKTESDIDALQMPYVPNRMKSYTATVTGDSSNSTSSSGSGSSRS
jgi:hypothetical protein